MNKFLRSASERYDQLKKKDYLINPMSEIDTEIAIEIGQILKKTGLNDVLEIFSSYKEVKDEEVRDQLMQWNIDHPFGQIKDLAKSQKNVIDSMLEGVEEQEKYPPFIIIGELTMKIYDLKGFVVYDKIDRDGNEIYVIKINPIPDHTKNIPLYSNYEIEYFDEQNRNEVLEQLRKVLSDTGTDFIDLNNT